MSRPLRTPLLVLAGLAAIGTPVTARADRSADVARAEAMFEEGRQLMVARDYANACPKLAESQRLDPAPGTLLNLAACYERAGKVASAWATYKAAQAATQVAGQKDRSLAATRKAAELEAKLSRITLTVSADARVPGLEIRCDGEPVREAQWGSALPYDPGPHDVEVKAPGRRAWHTHAVLGAQGEAERITIAVPVLEADQAQGAGATDAQAAAAKAGSDEAPGPAPAASGETGHGQRVAGIVVGLGGVVGLGVGVFTGLHAKSTYEAATAACGGGTHCPDATGLSLRSDASTWATTSTVAFIAGGALVAGGALLYFTSPQDPSGTQVGLGPAARGTGLSLTGRF